LHNTIIGNQTYIDENKNKDENDMRVKEDNYKLTEDTKIDKLKKLSKKYGMPDNLLIKYYKEYNRLKKVISTQVTKSRNDYEKYLHRKYKDIILNGENITLSLMHGFCYNICKKIHNDKYISMINLTDTGIYQIPNTTAYSNTRRVLINRSKINNYVLFLKLELEGKNITWLHFIHPKSFSYISYVYNKYRIEHMNKIATTRIYNITKYKSIKNNIIRELSKYIK
jgi:hypothetical protein